MAESPDADTAGPPNGGGQRRELSVRLTVPEMDCPSCAQKVDKSLQRVDGVVDATLQPTTGTASVTYDPDRTSKGDVVAAIEAAGYDVIGGAGDETDESDEGVDIAPPSEVWSGRVHARRRRGSVRRS